MTERLKAIEERAKALGWVYLEGVGEASMYPEMVTDHAEWLFSFNLVPEGCTAAESLLSLYEPGMDVVIKWESNDRGHIDPRESLDYPVLCDGECGLYADDSCCPTCGIGAMMVVEREPEKHSSRGLRIFHIPGPGCLGEGTFKLVHYKSPTDVV